MKTISQRHASMVMAALMWLIPMALHAQPSDQTPFAGPAEAPKIVFESLEHDFGTTKPGEPLTHEFIFTNQGTAALMIEKVKAG